MHPSAVVESLLGLYSGQLELTADSGLPGIPYQCLNYRLKLLKIVNVLLGEG